MQAIEKTEKTTPTVVDFLLVESKSDLKAYGHLKELKALLGSLLGLTISSKSWSSFYFLILKFQAVSRSGFGTKVSRSYGRSTKTEHRLLTILYRSAPRDSAERSASFNAHIVEAMNKISEAASDPKVKYRFSKTRNFVYSSRLEGLDLERAAKNTSLEALLEKHREH